MLTQLIVLSGCLYTDIDECSLYNISCGNDTTCINTPGHYVCACVPGTSSRNCKPFIEITTTTVRMTTEFIGIS